MNTPTSGINYLIAGFGLISKPGLKRFVMVPLLINVILFIVLFLIMRHYFSVFDHWFESLLPSWLHWLASILWVLFFVSFFLLLVYTFVTFANLISAPFNSFLSEKVELYLTGVLPAERSLVENFKDVPRIVGRQLAIIGYYLPRALLVLILFFLPGVQVVAPILWFLFNAWFLMLTYIDYPSDNHRLPLRGMRVWAKQRHWVALGFGASVLVISMVPLLNFFAIPAAVAGATKFWVEENNLPLERDKK